MGVAALEGKFREGGGDLALGGRVSLIRGFVYFRGDLLRIDSSTFRGNLPSNKQPRARWHR